MPKLSSICDYYIQDLSKTILDFKDAIKMQSTPGLVDIYSNEGVFLYSTSKKLALHGINTFPHWINILNNIKNNEYITLERYNFLMQNFELRHIPEIRDYQKINRDNIENDKKNSSYALMATTIPFSLDKNVKEKEICMPATPTDFGVRSSLPKKTTPVQTNEEASINNRNSR